MATKNNEAYFNLILENVSKHINITQEETIYFTSLLEYKKIKAYNHILVESEVCKYSVFVLKGCLRAYSIDKNGYEHVLSFAPENWWIADLYSLITQKPGILNIESLVTSEVFYLSKTNQEKLFKKVPKFERYFRILVENSLVANQQRLLDNLSLSAKEKYLTFCKKYPTLINTLPQKQIAAYIGVTPEFLSKVKSGLLRKTD